MRARRANTGHRRRPTPAATSRSAWVPSLVAAVDAGPRHRGRHAPASRRHPRGRGWRRARGRRAARRPPAARDISGRQRAASRRQAICSPSAPDCAVGKKYTALAIDRELRRRGVISDFRATGQTGLLHRGRGIVVDAVVADFIAGAAESAVAREPRRSLGRRRRPGLALSSVLRRRHARAHPRHAAGRARRVSRSAAQASRRDAGLSDPRRRGVRGPPRRGGAAHESDVRRCVGVSVNTSKMTPACRGVHAGDRRTHGRALRRSHARRRFTHRRVSASRAHEQAATADYPRFGGASRAPTGIRTLMADLGAGISGDQPLLMLGGGNPARIPAMHALFREQMSRIVSRRCGIRAHARGLLAAARRPRASSESLARLLQGEYGWKIGARQHLSDGSAARPGFFMLFNLLAGAPRERHGPEDPAAAHAGVHRLHGRRHRRTNRSSPSARAIEHLADRRFKYRVDFEHLEVGDRRGPRSACRVRRNPDRQRPHRRRDRATWIEIARARTCVPLIIDSAYGTPFPHIIFSEARPFLERERRPLSSASSKLGTAERAHRGSSSPPSRSSMRSRA